MKTGDLLFWYPLHGGMWPDPGILAFWCPACQEEHPYQVNMGHNWRFNGDFGAPVFSPSLLIYKDNTKATKCHLFVGGADARKPGMIEYCSDCPHELAGKTVPMVPWSEDENYWRGTHPALF